MYCSAWMSSIISLRVAERLGLQRVRAVDRGPVGHDRELERVLIVRKVRAVHARQGLAQPLRDVAAEEPALVAMLQAERVAELMHDGQERVVAEHGRIEPAVVVVPGVAQEPVADQDLHALQGRYAERRGRGAVR